MVNNHNNNKYIQIDTFWLIMSLVSAGHSSGLTVILPGLRITTSGMQLSCSPSA